MQSLRARTIGAPAGHPLIVALRDAASDHATAAEDIEAIPGWIAWIAVAGITKITIGLLAFGLAAAGWLPRLGTVGGSPWIYFSQVFVYAGVGLGLIAGSRRDRRAA